MNKTIRLFYVWLHRKKLYNKFKSIVKREHEKHENIRLARLTAFQFRDAHSVSDLDFDSFDGIIRIRTRRKVLWQHPMYHQYKALIKRQRQWRR